MFLFYFLLLGNNALIDLAMLPALPITFAGLIIYFDKINGVFVDIIAIAIPYNKCAFIKHSIDKFNKVSCTTNVNAVNRKLRIYSGNTPSSLFRNPYRCEWNSHPHY